VLVEGDLREEYREIALRVWSCWRLQQWLGLWCSVEIRVLCISGLRTRRHVDLGFYGYVQRKKRTQDSTQEHALASSGVKVPKSFVFSRGKLPALLRNLEKDVRKVMMPHTALNLRVRIM
jgi:hypothetical protein